MCQKLDFYAVLATHSLDQLSLPRKGLKSIVSPAIKLGVSPSLSPGQVILNPEQMQRAVVFPGKEMAALGMPGFFSVSFCELEQVTHVFWSSVPSAC